LDAMRHHRSPTWSTCERAVIASLRTTLTGVTRKPALKPIPSGRHSPAGEAYTGYRPVYFAEQGGFVPTPTYAREALRAGNRLDGPALVEEHGSTTVLPSGHALVVDALGNLVIDVAGGR